MLRKILVTIVTFWAGAAVAEGDLKVELNKLEASDGNACRAYFVFRNDTGMTMEAFEMSLALLDTNGVIDQLLTVDAAPIPIARTALKLFDFPEIGCEAISEILLHDIGSCRPQNGEEIDCFDILSLESKASAPLVK